MFKYLSVREEVSNEEVGQYTTFGIKGFEKVGFSWEERIYIPDVTLDKTAAEFLAKICTKEQLEPLHLEDVVIDYIG